MGDGRFTVQHFDEQRWDYLRMVGVTLTDRCPVGCKHCSVNALMGDAGPEVNSEFQDHVRQLSQIDNIETVFITGGEPFLLIDQLGMAVATLRCAGKRVVVHTSGYWGTTSSIVVPARKILSELGALVLGVDLYHRIGVTDDALQSTMSLARVADTWLVVQVIDGPGQPDHRSYAERMLVAALGENWSDYAEIAINPPLHVGRAAKLSAFRDAHQTFGRCDLINRPMLRFDREVTACCNEAVLKGAGPTGLRRHIESGVNAALSALAGDPLVDLIRALPTIVAYDLVVQVSGVTPTKVLGKCDACWRTGAILERMSAEKISRIKELATLLTASSQSASVDRVEVV